MWSQTEACQGKSKSAKAWSTSTSKKCSEVVVVPFDDGWPEDEGTFIDVQA